MTSRDVRGFLHVCCLGAYREVTWEIVHALLESGLYDRSVAIEVGVLGAEAEQQVVEMLLRPFERFRIAFRSNDLGEYEFPTLGLLQDACQTWNGPVYYVHTKGVSYPSYDQYSRYFRQLMLDEVVTNHERCLAELTVADAVGTLWRESHYSGNFWWARSSHIRRLPDIRDLQRFPRLIEPTDAVSNKRQQCEDWLILTPGRFAHVGYSGLSGLNLSRELRWTTSVADIINELLIAGAGRHFAELSMDGPSPYFGAVVADSKVSVLCRSETDACSEEDFLAADPPDGGYDVILVEVRHEPKRCLDVIERCLPKLSADGVVVVHHSNPPSAWHQRPAEEFEPGSEWSGQVWRAVVEFRSRHPQCEVFTVDTDWGCTVIRPSRRARHEPGALPVEALDCAAFERERNRLLNLVNVAWFRRHLYADPYLAGSARLVSSTELLNVLISVNGLDSHLEIGGAAGVNLAQIIAPIRQSVALCADATYQMVSDDFFACGLGLDRYDLIFVDGLHTEDQCRRDLENALARLSDRGWIVAHDANPPAEWHQRPVEQFEPGSEWNGTVWKALVRFRSEHPELELCTFDLDGGCALVRRRAGNIAPQPVPELPDTLDWAFFDEHRRELLNLVPASTEALRNLFCHEDAVWDDPCVSVRLEGEYHIESRRLDARNLDPQPYARDRDLLLAEVERNPKDWRSVFYLAQSYFDMGDFINAHRWYVRWVEMCKRQWWWHGSDAEVYVAMCRVAESMANFGAPWPDVQDAYLKAWEFRPTRAEPLYAIACQYRVDQRYRLGYLFAKHAAEIPFPEGEKLFVRADIYGWRATDEQAVCASWIGKHAEAFTLCRRLLARYDVPNHDRQRIAGNRDVSVSTMIDAASPYPEALVQRLLTGPGEAEVVVSLVAGPDRESTEQMLNSFLNCCTDVARVGRFLVVDAGLSAPDRAMLRQRYGFLEFAHLCPLDEVRDPGAQLAHIRTQIDARFWLHLGQGWRFFAPDNFISRLTAVLKAEPQVLQVGINFTDAVKLTGACAAEEAVRRAPDAGRYVLADVVASGPAMFDTARLDRTGGVEDTDPDPLAELGRRAAAAGLRTASLDEVLCIAAA